MLYVHNTTSVQTKALVVSFSCCLIVYVYEIIILFWSTLKAVL